MSATFANNTTNLEDHKYQIEDRSIGTRIGK